MGNGKCHEGLDMLVKSNEGNYYLICLEYSGNSDEIIHIQELAPQNFLK
jgi:hypothetical protein